MVATCRRPADSSSKTQKPEARVDAEHHTLLFSRILLFTLLALLATKLGVFTRLRRLKPRLDRAVNLIIIGLGVIYVGHLLWWLLHSTAQH